jgi:hypothetical protein
MDKKFDLKEFKQTTSIYDSGEILMIKMAIVKAMEIDETQKYWKIVVPSGVKIAPIFSKAGLRICEMIGGVSCLTIQVTFYKTM